MKLFKNALTEWEKTMTEEELDKMEAQGLDVRVYREKLAARRAQEAAAEKQDRERWQNPTQLDRLTPYAATPRSTETPFFRKVADKAPWFFKNKWLRKYTEGHIVYVGVVHAPAELWKGGKHQEDVHEIVGIFARDEAHRCDAAWAQRVSSALREMYASKRPVAEECREIMEMIPDESAWDRYALGGALAEGADACVQRLVIEDGELPQGYLPTDGIVPHFYWEGTISCIPAELYQ